MGTLNLTPDRLQHMVNLARDGCRSEVEREFVGAMAEAFSEMFGQQVAEVNAKKQAEAQAAIDARITEEVAKREEKIREELLQMNKQDKPANTNGASKS